METRHNDPSLFAGVGLDSPQAQRYLIQVQEVLQQAQITLHESRQRQREAIAALERCRHDRVAAWATLRESRDLLEKLATLRDPCLFPLASSPLPSRAAAPVVAIGEPLVPEEKRWLSVQEAAARGGMTDGAVRSALYKRRITYIELSGRKLIRTTDFDAYRASARVGRPRKKTGEDGQSA